MRVKTPMSETIAIQFLGALIAPFMVAYGIGYFIRKSIKLIAFMFGMFFVVVGVMVCWSNRQLQRDTEMA